MTTESPPTLLEKGLDEYYKTAKGRENLGQARRRLAYGLKVVTGGAGLVVASGLLTPFHQLFGVAVVALVLLDTVTANHLRMVAETKAGHAYASLSRRVRANYNREAGSIAQRAAADDPSAEAEMEQLMKTAHEDLSSGIDEIENRLADADIKALESLSLANEKKATGE